MNSLDIDKMNLDELRNAVNLVIQLINFEVDRIDALQQRILKLEMNSPFLVGKESIEASTEPT